MSLHHEWNCIDLSSSSLVLNDKKLLQRNVKNDGDDHFIKKMMMMMMMMMVMMVVVVVVVVVVMLMIMLRLLGNFRFLFSENLHFKSKGKRDFSRLKCWVSTAVCLNLPKKIFDRLRRLLT